MKISFSPPYIDNDIKEEVNKVMDSGWITTGAKVKELEDAVAGYCGVEKALAVNSATSALMLVLHWLGVKPGDEVIVPAYTYCATALAVMHAGATPVMVDVRDDFNIDPALIKKAITQKTKAIISVDIAGWPCDYNAIYNIINEASVVSMFIPGSSVQQQLGRIMLIADAAHSFGAKYKNKPAGQLADMTVFSFHAVKNITTAEGGIICLQMPLPFDNNSIYATLRLWSLNGQTKDAFAKTMGNSWRYDIVYPGFKINMPDVLAAIGLGQIKKYAELLMKRKEVVEYYTATLKNHKWAIIPPYDNGISASSYHIFALRIKDITEEQRDEIINAIMQMGVSVNVHFVPLPMLTVFKQRGYSIDSYPQSYKLYSGEVSLPVYPQLTIPQLDFIIKTVIESVKKVCFNE